MALEIGETAPDFTLRNRDGRRVSLSSLREGGSVVLLFFPMAFSEWCTVQFTDLAAARDRYGDARVVAVSVDHIFALRAFADSLGVPDEVQMLADFHPKGAVAEAYGVLHEAGFATRAAFVIDRDGIVRGASVLDPDDLPDEESLLAALAACPA
jgi:peroxiredoxin (alkyl hydroperoxide reductase subunit C)